MIDERTMGADKKFGRTIGLATCMKPNEPSNLFGPKTRAYENLVRQAADLSVDIVFFSPAKWQEGETDIDGFWFDGKSWHPQRVAIPKVVYDRFFSKKSQRPIAKSFRRFLRKNKYQLFTPQKLTRLTGNKNKFNQFMMEREIPCLPSQRLKDISEATLQSWLDSNGMVYSKPTYGMGGKGIVVVEKLTDDQFLFHSDGEPTTCVNSPCLSATLQAQSDFAGHMVQPKAKSSLFESSPLVVRVLMQNKGNRNYGLVHMLARAGAKDAWTTASHAETRTMPLAEIEVYYRQTFGGDIFEAGRTIESICLQCCHELHSEFGDFAELAFDVMLTHDLGPIIIEANSKPGREFLQLPIDAATNLEQRKQAEAIMDDSLRELIVFSLTKLNSTQSGTTQRLSLFQSVKAVMRRVINRNKTIRQSNCKSS